MNWYLMALIAWRAFGYGSLFQQHSKEELDKKGLTLFVATVMMLALEVFLMLGAVGVRA